ncbi:hypothetical protein LP421_01840 (plasmid) [Rhizobium sp. RCAM05350]|nr:hypothetical protein LP421_01840 [Rhizobium sp. RCAM05350]
MPGFTPPLTDVSALADIDEAIRITDTLSAGFTHGLPDGFMGMSSGREQTSVAGRHLALHGTMLRCNRTFGNVFLSNCRKCHTFENVFYVLVLSN